MQAFFTFQLVLGCDELLKPEAELGPAESASVQQQSCSSKLCASRLVRFAYFPQTPFSAHNKNNRLLRSVLPHTSVVPFECTTHHGCLGVSFCRCRDHCRHPSAVSFRAHTDDILPAVCEPSKSDFFRHVLIAGATPPSVFAGRNEGRPGSDYARLARHGRHHSRCGLLHAILYRVMQV